MTKIILSMALSMFCMGAVSQQPDAEGSLVKWMSLKEALHRNDSAPRPILVDFYTSWCGWCKQMMRTTYAEPGLSQYLNAYFYPVKFDAEGKDTVEYLGRRYGPSALTPRATHELAIQLIGPKQMYPTTLVLNAYDKSKKTFEISMLASGYMDRQKMEPILVYNVESVYRSASYDDFNEQFRKAFYDTTAKPVPVKWMTAREAFRDTMPRKRKTMIFLSAEWCTTCEVMQRTSFTDSLVADYLASHFDLVEFDVQSGDTLVFKGRTYAPQSVEATPIHPLAIALSRNGLVLPSVTVLDENLDPIDAIPYYLSPAFLNKIAHFFGDDIFKSKSWPAYMEELDKK